MLKAAPTHRAGIFIGDRPANVIVAAHVGGPGGVLGNLSHAVKGVGHQPRFTGGNTAPQHHHQLVVIRQLAFYSFGVTGTEIGHKVFRGHNCFSLEHHGGRRYADEGPQCREQLVHLGLVLAVGAEALPQEGHRVEPHDVNALVGEVEDDAEHRFEHSRVAVVEIPLELIERGPHPGLLLGQPGEVAGLERGEDLSQGFFVLVRLNPVRKQKVEIAILRIPGKGGLRPGVFFGRVVHDQVDAQADAALVQCTGELLEVVHGAESSIDFFVRRNRVAAVVFTLAWLQ